MIDNNFDYSRYINNSFYFCKFYSNMIIKKQIIKFGAINYIKVLFYQKQFYFFSDLIFIEKICNAYAYLIIFVINLRYNRTNLIILYHQN